MPINKMNKSDIVFNITKKSNSFSQVDVEKSINTIIEFISESLTMKNRVELRNFGSFSIRFRNKRLSRNPKMGTSVFVEAKNYPYFRASKNLKQSLNK